MALEFTEHVQGTLDRIRSREVLDLGLSILQQVEDNLQQLEPGTRAYKGIYEPMRDQIEHLGIEAGLDDQFDFVLLEYALVELCIRHDHPERYVE